MEENKQKELKYGKKCNKCLKEYAFIEFDQVSNKSKYLRSECKKCRKLRNLMSYEERKEEMKDEREEQKWNKKIFKEVFGEKL